MRLHSEEGHSGMYYEEHRPQVKGTDPSALVRQHFGALRDQVWAPQYERDMDLMGWVQHKDD